MLSRETFSSVALENLLKYGILIEPFHWLDALMHDPYHVPNLALVVSANVYILTALFIELKLGTFYYFSYHSEKEHLAEAGQLSNRMGFILYTVLLFLELFVPVTVVILLRTHPMPTVGQLSVQVIVFLKVCCFL